MKFPLATTSLLLVAAATFAGCASTDTAAQTKTVNPMTCAQLIPDVIKVAKDNAAAHNGADIVAVYKPTLIADHIAAFNAGTLTMPAGKNDVVVLACKGEAAVNDGSTVKINFQLSIDSNHAPLVGYQEQ